MTTTALLDKLNNHAFDMVKYGETKNAILLAFNAAVVAGMTKLATDCQNCYCCVLAWFVVAMSAIAILISLVALIATIKHTTKEVSIANTANLLFFATVAQMTHDTLLAKLKQQYQCTEENASYEKDLAQRAIITSQIATRKFKLFNWAIGFTFSGLATPLSVVVYKLFLSNNK
jgi:hypothetical protein